MLLHVRRGEVLAEMDVVERVVGLEEIVVGHFEWRVTGSR
jgi:hypothetical protein